MAGSKLELKIIKDSSQQDVELSSLSVEAAKSFIILLESLTKIVELTDEANNIKIEIKSGSAVASAIGPQAQIEAIETSYNAIISNSSKDAKLVSEWRNIQKLLQRNSLLYDISFHSRTKIRNIATEIKSAKLFRIQKRPKSIAEIEFLSGELIAVGGKKPNIHLADDRKNKIIIDCNQYNAYHARNYLYKSINVSAFVKRIGDKKYYSFCDIYEQQAVFIRFKDFIDEFEGMESDVDSYMLLHEMLKQFLDAREFNRARKLIRLFKHEDTDINILKGILIITKAFKEHETLKTIREEVKAIFDKKFIHLD